MKEAIAARVGRLIAGSVNAMIEKMESASPDMVMTQSLREVDAAIDEVRAELGRLLAGKHLANKRLMEENRRHEELGDQIELAVAEGREDLAEAAIARQFDIEAQLPVLQSAIADAATRQRELEGYIAALAARRREMETELELFRSTRGEGVVVPAQAGGSDAARRVGRAQKEFNTALGDATGVAASPSQVAEAGALVELEELARRNRIRERLAQLKARSGK